MNSMLKEEVLDLITKVSTIIKNFEVPNYTDNKNKCVSCVHKELCYNVEKINNLIMQVKNTKTTIKE